MHRYPKTRHDDVLDALAMRVQRVVWAESRGGAVDVQLGEWSFGAAERAMNATDGTGPEADLVNPSNEWKTAWPE